MWRKVFPVLVWVTLSWQAYASEKPEPEDVKDEDLSLEPLTETDREDALAYSQKELQGKFQSGAGLNLGQVMPWSKAGATFFGTSHQHILSFSLGFGDFEYSGNLQQRNYLVTTNAQSAYFASRYFIFGFGPLYVEPMFGFVHWNGSVRPRGNDNLTDVSNSSLSSRFDAIGVDAGANFGLMWIFDNGMFLDYNFMNLSKAFLLKETYTTSTSDARKAVRTQISGPITMSSVNLRLGYAFDF